MLYTANRFMTRILKLLLGTLFTLALLAPAAIAQKQAKLSQLWKETTLKGQLRNYWMGTINQDSLKDFSAAALGGRLLLTSGKYKGLSIRLAGYSSLNLGLSELEKTDPYTNKLSRYELGLFDVTNPSQDFIALLGEAYVKWEHPQQEVTLGRMLFKSPMLNPQDGRMIPTLLQGLWYQHKGLSKWKFGLGYFNAIAPRSTSRWYKVENSVGQYPQGAGPYGPGNYLGNISSPGLAVGNISWQPASAFSLRTWNYAFLNVSNTFYTDARWNYSLAEEGGKFSTEIQYIYQQALGRGGNDDPTLSYFPEDMRTHMVGFKTSYERPPLELSFAYTRIFGAGQLLFPREWGRDALFTFQKRERQEGFGDTHAFLLQARLKNGKSWLMEAGAGYYKHPEASNRRLNKYAQPSYYQVNLDLLYTPQAAALKNLDAVFLIAYKIGEQTAYDDANWVINKVNMAVFNLILNYNFTLRESH